MLLIMHNEMLLKSLEENRKSYEVWKSKIHAIASVLGNLLDNAITAGAEVSGSNIEVNIYMVNNNLCIKICNQTVSEQIDFTQTSAPDRLRHGIGLRSVCNSVQKMDGEFSIGERDGVVTAFVTLYNVCP